jgi:MFS family permease
MSELFMTDPRRSLIALSSIGLLAWMSYEMIRSPVLPLFAKQLGLPPEEIGFVVAASTLTGIVLKLPAGVLSDFYPRKSLLLLGALIFGVMPFGYLFIDNPGTLVGIRFIHGVATATFSPVVLAVIATMFRDRRAESLSWYSSATMAGGLLGPVLGGMLIYQAGYPVTFVTAGVFGLLALLLTWRLRLHEPHLQNSRNPAENSRGSREAGTGRQGKKEAWQEVKVRLVQGLKEVGGDARILITSATQAFQYMAIGTLQAFLPLYGLSVGLNEAQVGLLFGAQVVVTVLSKPMLGRWSDRIGRKPVIFIGLFLSAVMTAGIPWMNSFESLMVLAAGFGFGVALVTSSVSALVADLCQEKHYGSAMGLFGTIMDIGHASGPILAGLLIARFDYATAFAVVAVLLILSAVLFVQKVRTA